MYDTPHLHLDTSTHLPSFFETDYRRGAEDRRPKSLKVERRSFGRRNLASIRRG